MVAALVTGAIMRFAPSSWITWATGATLVHDALFFAIVAAVIAHVAFALSRPDQLVSMFNGRIPRSWAKLRAAAWLSEVEVSKGEVSEGDVAGPPGGSSP
jgi:cytochrome b subunit of formate dehydrogenase